MCAASLIRALSSSPSWMSPEREGMQKILYYFKWIISIFSVLQCMHISSNWITALAKSVAFQETSLKQRLACKCVGAAALLACLLHCSGAMWNTYILPEATRSVDLVGELRTSSCPPPPTYCSFPCLITCYFFPPTPLLDCQDIG